MTRKKSLKNYKHSLFLNFLFFTLLFTSIHGYAGNLLIWPINPVLEPNQQATSIWLENKGDAPLNLQIRVHSWRQEKEHDVLEEQQRIIPSPPFIHLDKGKRQLIRLVNTAGPTTSQQPQAFRVLVDEIPNRDVNTDGSNLHFQMRYSLPLFVGISKESNILDANEASALRRQACFSIERNSSDFSETYLRIKNFGNQHIRLSGVEAIDHTQQDKVVLSEGLLGYVLPHSSMAWPISESAANRLSHQTAALNFTMDKNTITLFQRCP